MENYIINKDGTVWSNLSNKYLKPEQLKNGYLRVELQGKKYLVHRLVADTYIPNPDNLPCVNHKDHNRANNDVSNLEWCSYEYNNSYSNCVDAMANSHKKPVKQLTKDGQLIKVWDCAADAEKALGIKHIYRGANGTRKTVGGYKWEYIQIGG